MSIKCLIIDDEPMALEKLGKLYRAHSVSGTGSFMLMRLRCYESASGKSGGCHIRGYQYA